MISLPLKNEGCNPAVSDGVADLIVAQTAISQALKATVTVIGEDTDPLVLLLHHSNKSNFHLYFRSDRSTEENKNSRTFSISLCQDILGKIICSIFLFLHAFTGCDSSPKISKIKKICCFQKTLL